MGDMKSKRTIALSIPKRVKDRVFERDGGRCILCGSSWSAMPNAHYISRAQGGLGIEENVVTLCSICHEHYDHTERRGQLRRNIRSYLKKQYPEWDETKLTYKKPGT